jgi:hypothetical protein
VIKNGAVKYACALFHSPFFTLSAARRPHPAHGRKMTKAFFFELIKIKPEI